MNSAKYWRKRSLYAKQKQLDAEGEYEVAMRSRLKDLENEILKEADYFITRYAETNEISKKNAAEILSSIDTSKFDMTLKEFRAKAIAGGFEKELDSAYFKTRINRLQKLHAQLAVLASKYAETEEQRMALALAEQYKGTYELQEYHKYLVAGGLDIDFAHFDEQQLKDIVYQPWQGSDFSKRIWNNYTKVMPDVLTDVIARSVLMGYSHQRVEKMLRDRFRGIEDKNLHRLAVTEMGHAAEQSTLQFYKNSNIDQYQYLATLESRTCDVCGHLDQKVFNVKDEKEGINYPLIHPYCRCTTVPYDPDLPDTPTRWSRDPITGKGKIIKNMSFSEWAEANGVKPLNKRKFLEAKPTIAAGAKSYFPRNLYERSLPTPEAIRQHRYSVKFYETLRNSNRTIQVEKIAKSSKLDKGLVKRAIEHILDSKYHLVNVETFKIEYMHFYPDVDMAHSLERLLENKPMEHDILMLKHEALEAKLMDSKNGKFYDDYENAHKETNKKYAYDEECRRLRKQGILPSYEDEKKEGDN